MKLCTSLHDIETVSGFYLIFIFFCFLYWFHSSLASARNTIRHFTLLILNINSNCLNFKFCPVVLSEGTIDVERAG